MNAFGVFMILLAIFVVIVFIARLFNHLVLVKHNVQRAWADICVLLRQRQEELGKLIIVCREHATFEGGMLEGITRARKLVDKQLLHGDPGGLSRAERGLRQDLAKLIAVAEAHPTLGAAESFRHLSRRISDLESSIADRRVFYNASVEINNSTIQSFPELLLAGPFGFKDAQFLVFDARQTEDVGVARTFAAG
jgi:LemA protein